MRRCKKCQLARSAVHPVAAHSARCSCLRLRALVVEAVPHTCLLDPKQMRVLLLGNQHGILQHWVVGAGAQVPELWEVDAVPQVDADDGACQELGDVDDLQPVAQADAVEAPQRPSLGHAVRHRYPLQVAAFHKLLDLLVRLRGEVAVRRDGVELRRRGELVQRDAHAGHVAARVKHVVDDDDGVDALRVRVRDEPDLPDASNLLAEALHHHEADSQLVCHVPRELQPPAVCRTDHHAVLAEVGHVTSDEVCQVLV
mmetsp:Transcript_122435/g.357439  ORF Transcript_122435/g.357439 Transcript_122435/m.357439 type:complete len:256 (-) Transcript_122435:658-1425(-)